MKYASAAILYHGSFIFNGCFFAVIKELKYHIPAKGVEILGDGQKSIKLSLDLLFVKLKLGLVHIDKESVGGCDIGSGLDCKLKDFGCIFKPSEGI